MRTSKIVAAAVIGVISAGYTAANAQSLVSGIPAGAVNLYSTATDWGGSYENTNVAAFTGALDGNVGEHVNPSTGQVLSANQATVVGPATPDVATQIGYAGWGNGTSYPNPVNDPVVHDSPVSPKALITFTPGEADSVYGGTPGADTPGDGDLDGSTINGLGNYDNSGHDSTTPDANGGGSPPSQYVGQTSPAGGITFVYPGGYNSISSSELNGDPALLNAIGISGTFYINFTLPGGATSIAAMLAANPGSTESYLGLGLRTFDSNGVNDLGGAYFGSNSSANGIFTAAIPYNYSSYGPDGFADIQYGGFNIYYNSDLAGVSDFVTIDSMSVVQNPVPEPASLSLIGLAGGMLMRRRRTA